MMQYVTLFDEKIRQYWKKLGDVSIGDSIETKLIRMTAEKLDRRSQMVLTPSALKSCELEDLLR